MKQAYISQVYEENQGYIATVAKRYSSFLGDGFEDIFQELSVELVAQLKRATGKHSTLQEIRWACKRAISRMLKQHYVERLPEVVVESGTPDGEISDSVPASVAVPQWCSEQFPGFAEALADGMTVPQIAKHLGMKKAAVLCLIRRLRASYIKDGVRG